MAFRLDELNAALTDRYDVQRPLGQGGMATVWLAHDQKHDRPVAIKLLRPELVGPVGAERFSREIAIVAKLNHPNILGVIDSGLVELNGLAVPYYVMPYVEGPSLATRMEQGERLTVTESLRLAAEVADGLEFAHSRGVVHRDIKPGNILIQAGHALVSDFGVAVALDAATGSRTTTGSTELLGTPLYMSPEQASGSRQLDGRSDVYSLGCVLYEMLAGDPPFKGITPQAMVVAHLTEPPVALSSRRPDIPGDVSRAVHRALAKLPTDRYSTAGSFRDTLESLRTSLMRRQRWWPTIALVVAVAAIVWWRPWEMRSGIAPRTETVVVLSGFRDRTSAMRPEAAALDDTLRMELQAVPGLRVIDVTDQPEQPVDSLRRWHGADIVIRGALDKLGDSVSATVRLLDVRDGSEVKGNGVRVAKASQLTDVATRLGRESLFGSVRFGIDSILLERWKLSLGTDSATAPLRKRARLLRSQAQVAMSSVGPRRMLADLGTADSLLALAMAQSPRSAVPLNDRASLGAFSGFMLLVVRQFFPDSTWVPPAVPRLQQAIPLATAAIAKAPQSADARLTRAQIYLWLLAATQATEWRDSALTDLRVASSLAGGRADIWSLRATLENQAGLARDALFSSQQGQAADHLFTSARELLYAQGYAQLLLQQEESALQSCRTGAAQFPDDVYFIDCEGDVLGRLSRDPRAARHVLALADSLQVLKLPDMAAITPEELRLFAAAIFDRAGQQDQAAHVYDSVTSRWGKAVDAVLLLDAAYVRQEHGDMDSALTLAARAVRQDSTMVVAMERQPWYQRLRQQPGFQAAMQGIPPAGGR